MRHPEIRESAALIALAAIIVLHLLALEVLWIMFRRDICQLLYNPIQKNWCGSRNFRQHLKLYSQSWVRIAHHVRSYIYWLHLLIP